MNGSSPSMVIISYNIRSRRPEDRQFLAKIGDIIRTSHADIACLQGVVQRFGHMGRLFGQSKWLGERLGMGFVYQANESIVSGNLLLTKYKVLNTNAYSITIGGLLEALLSTPVGLLSVFCTQWGDDADVRIKQASETAEILNSCPNARILCGDLGEPESGQAVRKLIDEAGLVDLMALGGCNLPTFPSSAPNIRRDYILGAGSFSVAEARVVDSQVTDHKPVVVRV